MDGIQKCKIVFKLKIFNLHIQNFRYKMLFCICLSYLSCIDLSYFELFKQRAVIAYFATLDLSIHLLFNQKDKGTFNNLQEKIKKFKFLSSREHPRVHLCCAAPTFMLFHYSLFFKFVNNFEISCQDNGFTLYNSILLMRADDFLSIINFGVSTAILNPVDVYRRWCKLSFTRMRDQVKHVIFLNRQARGDHIFTFYTNILE